MRLDDIGGDHIGITPLPSTYYKGITEEGVTLVYKPPHDVFTRRMLEIVRLNMNVIEERTGSEQEAFYTILSSTHVVLATSSFSLWAVLLSPYVERVIAPRFGVMLRKEEVGGFGLEEWGLVELRGRDLKRIKRIEELN